MVKEYFKKFSFAQKENSLHVFEKRQFFAQLQQPLVLYHEPKSIKNLFTKKNSLAHYLLYTILMTNVSVLGAEQFQFPFRVIFDSFCSNWFKLVSAQSPNSQTSRHKKDIVVSIKIFGPNISSSFDMIMSTALKDTRR